ncbi:hypothetical protein H0H81_002679 [Sphagnurus paluster]|uniref:F-box domain-containing protein n=1 Tax=Sphagnurus paluster TaxID=117069 RepID=A0A9P7K5N3_9AGAR|nr:hypothetical protein H0H81_002679 [Sphagnurus paluster]
MTLYQEEHRLLDALSAVRTKLNSLAPVSTLPNELLEIIFGFCVSWLHDQSRPTHRLAWTQFIDLCQPRLAHEFLLRSQSAPIRVSAISPSRLSFKDIYIGGLALHVHRITSLDLHLFPEDMSHLFTSMGPMLPCATELSLRVPPVSANFAIHDFPSTPQLKSLTLDCVTIPWNLSGLNHLSLRGQGPGYSPSVTQLCAVFQSSPDLESIRLTCMNPVFDVDASLPVSVTRLPRLREFRVAGVKRAAVKYLLSSITIPSTASLHICCSTKDTQLQSLDDVFPPGIMGLNSLTLRLEPGGFHFFSSATAWLDASQSAVSFVSTQYIPEDLLLDLPRFFDLISITTLEVGKDTFYYLSRMLVPLLALLPNINTIHIAPNSSYTTLLRVLANPAADDEFETEPVPTPDVLCPLLETISFGRAQGGIWFEFVVEWLPMVLALARARSGLRVLRFAPCCDVIGAEELEELEKLVPVIDFHASNGA